MNTAVRFMLSPETTQLPTGGRVVLGGRRRSADRQRPPSGWRVRAVIRRYGYHPMKSSTYLMYFSEENGGQLRSASWRPRPMLEADSERGSRGRQAPRATAARKRSTTRLNASGSSRLAV